MAYAFLVDAGKCFGLPKILPCLCLATPTVKTKRLKKETKKGPSHTRIFLKCCDKAPEFALEFIRSEFEEYDKMMIERCSVMVINKWNEDVGMLHFEKKTKAKNKKASKPIGVDGYIPDQCFPNPEPGKTRTTRYHRKK